MTKKRSYSSIAEHEYCFSAENVSDQKKRQKRLSKDQILDLDIILDRILLQMINDREKLPTEYTTFLTTVSQLCRVGVRVDVTVVFYHLLFNKVILLLDENQICVNSKFDTNKPLVGFVPAGTSEMIFSCDFHNTLMRCVDWVGRCCSFPVDVDRFLQELAKQCVFVREVSSSEAVNLLIDRGYIVVSGSQVSYCLPTDYVPLRLLGHFQAEYHC
eukprot:TRINITY_DN12490_c0_g1_i1.p1 TRINITY_DN12490_c0_g1~~TRINITY_DN12490_c0_g1_i1.p1  ORF type:complete len:215 (+),score=7.34 TRINITY_DN12490_c0_g1_i1:29-673(+)